MAIVADFVVDCPFCGVRVLVSERVGAVIHALPTCSEYDLSEDSLAFVKRCKEELKKRTR